MENEQLLVVMMCSCQQFATARSSLKVTDSPLCSRGPRCTLLLGASGARSSSSGGGIELHHRTPYWLHGELQQDVPPAY